MLGVLLLGGAQGFEGTGLAWGSAARVVGGLGLLPYCRALAAGPASIVVPSAAAGTAVPVIVGLVRGDTTSALALVGLAVVVVGITVVAVAGGDEDEPMGAPPPCGAAPRGPVDDPGPDGLDLPTVRTVPLALVAAALLGAFFVLLDEGAGGAGELLVTLGIQLGGLALNAGDVRRPVIAPSAYRHGLGDETILHAFDDPVRGRDLDDGPTALVGPDRAGDLLGVGVDCDDGPVVVRAVPARPEHPRRRRCPEPPGRSSAGPTGWRRAPRPQGPGAPGPKAPPRGGRSAWPSGLGPTPRAASRTPSPSPAPKGARGPRSAPWSPPRARPPASATAGRPAPRA